MTEMAQPILEPGQFAAPTMKLVAMSIRASFHGALQAVVLSASVACLTSVPASGEGSVGGKDSGSASSSGGTLGSNGGGSSGASSSGSDTGASSGASGSGAGSTSGSGSSGGTDSGSTTVDCVDLSTTSGAVVQQYGSAELVVGAGKSYFLQSNWWQTYSNETEDYTGLSFTVHNPQGASVPLSNGAPMGFPSIFIGQYAGNTTIGSNLPKQVSALTSVPTIYKTNNSSIGTSNHNAAYDVWFTQSNSALSANQSNPGAGGAYLMVWMFKPTDRQPRGSANGRAGQTISGVSGTWSVWVDTTNPPCVSYVSDTPLDGLEFDLYDFIKDAVGKSYGITSSMYLSVVFGGFEIWGGADGIALRQFCASVN
jgi:hypothetical protein